MYNLSICKEGKSHEIIEEDKSNLPIDYAIGNILRKENGKYILDMQATNEVSQNIENMCNELLKEQEIELSNNRIEGHTYEVYEVENDRVWLFDTTYNSEEMEAFEEIDFPKELINKISQGDIIKYQDGKYVLE